MLYGATMTGIHPAIWDLMIDAENREADGARRFLDSLEENQCNATDSRLDLPGAWESFVEEAELKRSLSIALKGLGKLVKAIRVTTDHDGTVQLKVGVRGRPAKMTLRSARCVSWLSAELARARRRNDSKRIDEIIDAVEVLAKFQANHPRTPIRVSEMARARQPEVQRAFHTTLSF